MGLWNYIKGQMHGGKIIRSVGEVRGSANGMVKSELKVLIAENNLGEKLIGIELVSKSILSYEMHPITLTVDACRELQSLLAKAIV